MKKAKLDALEDIPDIEMGMSDDQQIALDHDIEEPVAVGRKWALNKLLIILAPIGLVVLIVSGILIYYLTKTIHPVHQTPINSKTAYPATEQQLLEKADLNQNAASIAANASESLKMIYVKDFMIDLKDSKGNNYVLTCDLAFDVGNKIKLEQLENNIGVRDIIYKTAQSRSVAALRTVSERKKMKKELVLKLDKMLGEGSVKNVYFLNYFIM